MRQPLPPLDKLPVQERASMIEREGQRTDQQMTLRQANGQRRRFDKRAVDRSPIDPFFIRGLGSGYTDIDQAHSADVGERRKPQASCCRQPKGKGSRKKTMLCSIVCVNHGKIEKR